MPQVLRTVQELVSSQNLITLFWFPSGAYVYDTFMPGMLFAL